MKLVVAVNAERYIREAVIVCGRIVSFRMELNMVALVFAQRAKAAKATNATNGVDPLSITARMRNRNYFIFVLIVNMCQFSFNIARSTTATNDVDNKYTGRW